MDLDIPDIAPISASLDSHFTPKILDACDLMLRSDNPSAIVVSGLAKRCYSLYRHLRRALSESDVHYVSWAARTLFELKVLTAYVSSSQDNLERFRKEMFVDAKDAVKRTLGAVSALNDTDISAATDGNYASNNAGP